MPYKVVQTIENGKICLTPVPHNWEKEGTLSWPPRSEASSMLDENSSPGKHWSTLPCIVKRTCNTLKAARMEIKAMEYVTDTEEEFPTTVVQQKNNVLLDINHLMQVGGDSTDSAAIESPITVTTGDLAMVDQMSLNDVNTSFLLKNDMEEVVKNQAKMLEVLQDIQNTQKKILQQLATHEVHYNELLNNMADCCVTARTTETNRECTVEERFPPLKTVEELFQLEDNLKNPEFRIKYFKIMSPLCSPCLGAKGTNVCYKVIDYFFSRELLTLVTWSGNSRDQNEKIAFKFFTQIRQMFFSVIHIADPTISQLETDNFMKAIIKNSRQRFQATLKPLSVSTPKNRKKSSNNVKLQTDTAESNKETTADVDVEKTTVSVDEQNND